MSIRNHDAAPQPNQRRLAATLARRAVHDLARYAGARSINRPAYRGAPTMVPEVDPLAGLGASRQIELAARERARDYARAAREAGHSWHDIGTALGLISGRGVQQAGETVAEAAFTYAAGQPDSEHARRYGRSVAWTCGSCDRTITDHGLCNGPADDERGHADNCRRLAATIAAWDAEWESLETDWEAGQ